MTDGHRQDWQPLLDELTARRTRARAMGGAAKLAARRTPSRLDARARVAELCDTGSFRELGLLAGLDGAPADGFVAGSGTMVRFGEPVISSRPIPPPRVNDAKVRAPAPSRVVVATLML